MRLNLTFTHTFIVLVAAAVAANGQASAQSSTNSSQSSTLQNGSGNPRSSISRQMEEQQRQNDERRLEAEFGPRTDKGDVRPVYAGAAFSEEQISDAVATCIKQADKDGDGRLSAYEFQGVETAAIFEFLDADNDGHLMPAELRVYMREHLPVAAAREVLDKPLDKLMRKHDKNRNGSVTADEFRGRDEDFKRIDADGDGTISRDEMRGEARREFEEKHDRLPPDVTRFDRPTGGRVQRAAEQARAAEDRQKEQEARQEEMRKRMEEMQKRLQPKQDDGDGDADGK
ncbi:MAG: EF-hand domain-containing protein [Planctomycetota bacterium]